MRLRDLRGGEFSDANMINDCEWICISTASATDQPDDEFLCDLMRSWRYYARYVLMYGARIFIPLYH